MEEERQHNVELQNEFVQHDIGGSTGGRTSQTRKLAPKKVPVKSVETCLDGLDELMRGNGGRLPIECTNEE